ncbi:hypothetical protein B0H11DRAFT_1911400 [Mycena galericulata]|nr:hypothetical protein B0H11DRAFT_1911400 [Mycena galericulata]
MHHNCGCAHCGPIRTQWQACRQIAVNREKSVPNITIPLIVVSNVDDALIARLLTFYKKRFSSVPRFFKKLPDSNDPVFYRRAPGCGDDPAYFRVGFSSIGLVALALGQCLGYNTHFKLGEILLTTNAITFASSSFSRGIDPARVGDDWVGRVDKICPRAVRTTDTPEVPFSRGMDFPRVGDDWVGGDDKMYWRDVRATDPAGVPFSRGTDLSRVGDNWVGRVDKIYWRDVRATDPG